MNRNSLNLYDCLNTFIKTKSPLLFRWFVITERVAKLAEGVYLVDSSEGNENALSGKYIKSIHKLIKSNINMQNPPACCIINPEYGNFHSS